MKPISSHTQQQDVLGFLQILQKEQLLMQFSIHWLESAKANELDVYEYLKYLLNEMPNKDFNNHPEILDQYLPWSTELPDECRLTHRHKKCLKN